MTLGLAVICQYEKHEVVICCADSQTTILEYGTHTEGLIKIERIFGEKNVYVLLAGTTDKAFRAVGFFQKHLNLKAQDDGEVLFKKFLRCANFYRNTVLDEDLRRVWSTSLKEFKTTGCMHFPESIRETIAQYVASPNRAIDCDLIFVCFEGRYARLFVMHSYGGLSEETQNGFAAIGSGTIMATAQLNSHNYVSVFKLPEALYLTYEAKKVSEAEVTVGADTFMSVCDPNDLLWVNEEGFEYLEAEFDIRHAAVENIKISSEFFRKDDTYQGMINLDVKDSSSGASVNGDNKGLVNIEEQ